MNKNISTQFIFFASERYYANNREILKIANAIFKSLKFNDSTMKVITNTDQINYTLRNENIYSVLIPLSGGVQSSILSIASTLSYFSIYAAYIKDPNHPYNDILIEKNAPPALMDVYGVLKRNKHIDLCLDKHELIESYELAKSIIKFKNSRLIRIGQTEPWVISNSSKYELLKNRYNINLLPIELRELYEIYEKTPDNIDLYNNLVNNVNKIIEPSKNDINNALRLQIALFSILEKYKATGIALACFKLLSDIKTTGCIGLSAINDSDSYVASCEGDVDSLVTLLLLKSLTNKSSFMANPNLQSDRTINFVHCTAPKTFINTKYNIRSHHESQIGVSPEFIFNIDKPVTVARISKDYQTIHIARGKILEPVYENSCRSQIRIDIENTNNYLSNILGCHQIITIGDYKEKLTKIAKRLEMNIV